MPALYWAGDLDVRSMNPGSTIITHIGDLVVMGILPGSVLAISILLLVCMT
jgi:hypothetical protein